MGRWKRIARRSIALTLLLIIVVVALVVWRVRAEPEHWQQQQASIAQTPELDLDRMSKQLQLRAPREWSRPVGRGEDGVRTLRFNYDEINAWLVMRLDEWLANQDIALPPEIGDMIMTELDGQPVFAASIQSKVGPQIITLGVDAEQSDEGYATFKLGLAMAGKQKIPPEKFVARLRDALPSEDQAVVEALDTLAKGQAVGPVVLPVGPGRQATVLDLQTDEYGFDLTVRVEYTED